jgi:hypothetical protein
MCLVLPPILIADSSMLEVTGLTLARFITDCVLCLWVVDCLIISAKEKATSGPVCNLAAIVKPFDEDLNSLIE